MIGKKIHNYEVRAKIGEGGMGKVYKAVDTTLGRIAALKFLTKKDPADPDAEERFIQEAQAAAALNHPNIITVYEINRFEDQLYIAMELVEGQTLQDKIEMHLEWQEITRIALQACEGLSRAHQKGIIHRDIKPQNIMINQDNRVKILDFGTAKLKKNIDQLTKELCIMGTIHYMSPEQLNYKELDQRCDIWALGVVIYQLIAGFLPFNGGSLQTIFSAILNDVPKPLSSIRSGLPEELGLIVEKSMRKERDNRYQDIQLMSKELQSLLNQHTLLQSPGSGFLAGTITDAGSSAAQVPISIAVLPFKDLSPQQDHEYFCDGISEELISQLTHIEGLKVAARTTAFQFKNSTGHFEEIRQKIGVQYVLEGSVQKAGNRLRINTKLINTTDGCNVWAQRFDRQMEDIFAIQDEITFAVVKNLEVKLLGKSKPGKRLTQNEEAYNLYLKGRYFWNRRYEGGLKTSIQYFQQSIREDENYALPYVGIADSYNILGLYGFIPPGDAFNKAKKAAKTALQIQDQLPEALVSLGWIQNFYDWDWEEAEKVFQQAVNLNPNYATAYEWYALCLATRGQLEEAVSNAKIALRLDPLSLIINSVLSMIYIFSHKFPEAEEQLKKTLEMDPNFLLAQIWYGEILLFNKKYDEAIETFKQARSASPDMTYVLANLGYTYGVSGQMEEAKSIIANFDEISKTRYISMVQKAQVYIGMGDMEKGFEFFEKACQMRDPFCVWLKASPHFEPIHSDPRFTKLLKQIGLEEG